MAPLPAPAEKPSHRVSDSQSHAKLRPPAQVAVFCAALWPKLQPALTPASHLDHGHAVGVILLFNLDRFAGPVAVALALSRPNTDVRHLSVAQL